jgi:hypothetical protein
LLENLTVERKLYNGVGKIRPPELGNSAPPLTKGTKIKVEEGKPGFDMKGNIVYPQSI